MKKTLLLHPAISSAIAALGHGEGIVIADAGLPVPAGPQRIDLALSPGVPSFEQVLRAVASEMQVELMLIAVEATGRSPQLRQWLEQALPGVPIEAVAHETFKQRSAQARAVIRCGECTPYANVMLVAGVTF